MMHAQKPGWFYSYGYNWKPYSYDAKAPDQKAAMAAHFTDPQNRERTKNKHGMACECKDCLAGIRLVFKGWRPDKG